MLALPAPFWVLVVKHVACDPEPLHTLRQRVATLRALSAAERQLRDVVVRFGWDALAAQHCDLDAVTLRAAIDLECASDVEVLAHARALGFRGVGRDPSARRRLQVQWIRRATSANAGKIAIRNALLDRRDQAMLIKDAYHKYLLRRSDLMNVPYAYDRGYDGYGVFEDAAREACLLRFGSTAALDKHRRALQERRNAAELRAGRREQARAAGRSVMVALPLDPQLVDAALAAEPANGVADSTVRAYGLGKTPLHLVVEAHLQVGRAVAARQRTLVRDAFVPPVWVRNVPSLHAAQLAFLTTGEPGAWAGLVDAAAQWARFQRVWDYSANTASARALAEWRPEFREWVVAVLTARDDASTEAVLERVSAAKAVVHAIHGVVAADPVVAAMRQLDVKHPLALPDAELAAAVEAEKKRFEWMKPGASVAAIANTVANGLLLDRARAAVPHKPRAADGLDRAIVLPLLSLAPDEATAMILAFAASAAAAASAASAASGMSCRACHRRAPAKACAHKMCGQCCNARGLTCARHRSR